MGFIYKITNSVNGKVYIGKTTRTIEERYVEHLRHASNHENRYLYDAMNKYGYDKFIISVIEAVPDELLNEKEQYYISLFDSMNKQYGYNMTIGGDGVPVLPPEIEAVRAQKISKALSGRSQPKELIEKRVARLRGKKRSAEQRAKLSLAMMGRVAWNKGQHWSEATKQKLRECNLGKIQSPETKQKRSESMHKLKWYNNGVINIRTENCPDGFVPGRIGFVESEEGRRKSAHPGTHWYNNGIVNIMATECPVGFVVGRMKKGGN